MFSLTSLGPFFGRYSHEWAIKVPEGRGEENYFLSSNLFFGSNTFLWLHIMLDHMDWSHRKEFLMSNRITSYKTAEKILTATEYI